MEFMETDAQMVTIVLLVHRKWFPAPLDGDALRIRLQLLMYNAVQVDIVLEVRELHPVPIVLQDIFVQLEHPDQLLVKLEHTNQILNRDLLQIA